MADWSQIHFDILFLIINRITSISDHIRISGVCSWWRSVAMQYRYTLPHPTPALMVATYAFPTRSQLLSFPRETRTYHDLGLSSRDRCCGSHKGWLFLVEKGFNSIYLFNPFIKERRSLPCLDLNSVTTIQKAVLSSSPSADANCIVLILLWSLDIMFCRIGDESWTNLNHGYYFRQMPHPLKSWTNLNHDYYFDRMPHPFLRDALFFGDRFYVVDCYGEIHTCNFENQDMEKVSPQPEDATNNSYRGTYKWYLVDIEGEMHRVQRVSQNGGKGSTRMFLISKMNANNQWISVSDLKEYALFLGWNNSLAVSGFEQGSGIKGNRIYFTDDMPLNLRDMGIFDLGDSSIKPLCPTQRKWLGDRPPVWVAPIPW